MLSDIPSIICSVCLGDISYNNLCKTECNHLFCKDCLDKWFNKNKISCPMCRNDIKYFNYKGVENRIVPIYNMEIPQQAPQQAPRQMRAIVRRNIGPNMITINKQLYIILNMGLTFSIITNCILFGLWIDTYH